MKATITTVLGLLLILVMSCRDEEKTLAPIIGKWRGTLAEIKIQPFGIPLPVSQQDDSFDTEIEFKSDGTLIVYDQSGTTEGTWELRDDQLITDIDFSTDFIDVSGTYTVDVLTATTLVFHLEKENQTVTDPDSGQSISGDIKATLHFEKI